MASAFALAIAEKRKPAHKEPPMKLDDIAPHEQQQLPVQRHVGRWSKP